MNANELIKVREAEIACLKDEITHMRECVIIARQQIADAITDLDSALEKKK